MAVEFRRVELKNASPTYDENMKPKVIYLENKGNADNDENNFRKVKLYKCTHKDCN